MENLMNVGMTTNKSNTNFDVLCIHHNDMDGYASAMCAKLSPLWRKKTFKFISAHYDMAFDFSKLKKTQYVFILDFSLPVQYFDELVDRVGIDHIIWIDHHLSSINKYKNYPNINAVPGIRINGLAACELTYLHFFRSVVQLDETTLFDPGMEVSVNGCEVTLESLLSPSMDGLFPKSVRMAGLYDTWRFTTYEDYMRNLMFNDGFYAEFERPSNESCDFWDAFFDMKLSQDVTNQIMVSGKPIVDYKNRTFVTDLQRAGFECYIRKFEDIDAIAINTLDRGSFIFETVKNDYEVGLVFFMNTDGKMEYSIYRLGKNPEKSILVNKIAESFGGGGHAGASGFITNGTLVVERK